MLTDQTIVKVKTAGGIDEICGKRVRGVTIRDDGTIWANNNSMPLLTANDSMGADELKALHAKGAFDEIPDANFVRLGVMPNGNEALLWDDFKARRDPIEKAEAIKQKLKKMRSVSIHLSSRGWCDFTPVIWHGDFETPIEQIISECQSLLKTSHDVDFPNQNDSEIKKKIELALKERIAKKETWEKAYNEALQIINETSTATKAAYQECKGDPDKLYEDIDNPQYWSVSKYSHALSVKYTYENNYI